MARTLLLIGLLGALGASATSCGDTPPSRQALRVAAASDLKFAMDEIVRRFEAENPGINVDVAYGSSGNYHAQLLQRAPFDAFFSADVAYARELVSRGLTRDDLFMYAIGRLVVWVPNASAVDIEKLGMQALKEPAVRRIAIANPRHAPYGRAAEAAMRRNGVWDEVQSKLVLGENIAQAAQFVESGAADVGVIARSLAVAPAMYGKGRFWEVPADAHPLIEQAAVTMSWARDPKAATLFHSFVRGVDGRAILTTYGFELPGQ